MVLQVRLWAPRRYRPKTLLKKSAAAFNPPLTDDVLIKDAFTPWMASLMRGEECGAMEAEASACPNPCDV